MQLFAYDTTTCGSAVSIRSLAYMGFLASFFDFSESGFTLSLRSYAQPESSVFPAGLCRPDLILFVFDGNVLGFVLSLHGFSRTGLSLLVVDLATSGSAILLQSFA